MALTSTEPLTACVRDPDRWALATEPDNEAIALCRACPRRWQCAREACDLSGVQGIWAGVFVAESGRPRTFARASCSRWPTAVPASASNNRQRTDPP